MERARTEIVSVALSASRDRQSRKAAIKSPDGRKHTMSWTPLSAVLGLTFRIGYNIPLATRPGPGSPGSKDKETFAGEDERSQGRGERSGAVTNRSGGVQRCAVRYPNTSIETAAA